MCHFCSVWFKLKTIIVMQTLTVDNPPPWTHFRQHLRQNGDSILAYCIAKKSIGQVGFRLAGPTRDCTLKFRSLVYFRSSEGGKCCLCAVTSLLSIHSASALDCDTYTSVIDCLLWHLPCSVLVCLRPQRRDTVAIAAHVCLDLITCWRTVQVTLTG